MLIILPAYVLVKLKMDKIMNPFENCNFWVLVTTQFS